MRRILFNHLCYNNIKIFRKLEEISVCKGQGHRSPCYPHMQAGTAGMNGLTGLSPPIFFNKK